MLPKTVNILIVEDDDVDAKGIERAFAKARIANPLFRALCGIEALDMLRGTGGHTKLATPYLILVDINMPLMNGIDFLRELRQDDALKQSIVFVLTTSRRDTDKIAAYNLNVAGYILKENLDQDFLKLVDMLDLYWRLIEFP